MTPHDSLFHFAFRWVRHARSWFRFLFAPSSHAAVDWTSMLPATEKVRGRQLRLQVTDLLFEALLVANQHRLYLTPEHNAESPQPTGEARSAEPEVVDARRAAGRRTVAARDGSSR